MMTGLGIPSGTLDFFVYNNQEKVYSSGTGNYGTWSDGSYINYRVPATEAGTSGRFTATEPASGLRFELRLRSATLAGSSVVYEDLIHPLSYQDIVSVSGMVASLSSSTEGSYEVGIYTYNQDNEEIGGSSVEIKSSGTDSLIGLSYSNSSTAKATFNLDSGNYKVNIYKTGVVQWTNPNWITVTQNQNFTFNGNDLTIPIATTPDLIRVYIYTNDVGLGPVEGIEMKTFPLESFNYNDTYGLDKDGLTSTSDASGFLYADLAPNLSVRVKIPQVNFYKEFTTPSSGTLNLLTI